MKQTLLVANLILAAAIMASAQKTPESMLGAAMHQEEVQGDLKSAIAGYQKVVAAPGVSRKTAAQSLLRMGQCYEKLGDAESRKAYERVVREFADQKDVVAAADSHLRSLDERTAKENGVVAKQIWVESWLNLEGAPSNDGRYFVSPDSDGNVSIRDLRTGQSRPVTHDAKNGERAFHPVLSPDGKHVAYMWTGNSIRVTSFDGARTRTLNSGFPLGWTPDSKRLLAIHAYDDSRGAEYSFISINDGSRSFVKSFKMDKSDLPYDGSISPDGRYIVYSVRSANAKIRGIFAIAADGSHETPLIQGTANDTRPFWTPDGKAVVFTSDRSGTVDLWLIGIADGKPQGSPKLLRANIGEIGLGFVRDGSYYYGTRTQEDDVYMATIDRETLKVIEQPRRVSERFAGHNLNPEWSPDGKSIVFLRRGAAAQRAGAGVFGGFGVADVIVQSMVTGEERSLAKIQANLFGTPKWFPDGKSLLMADRVPIQYLQIDAQTGSARVLAKDLEGPIPTVALSRDGKSLFYSSAKKPAKSHEVLTLIKRDLDSGRETELYRTESWGYGLFELAVSPDGTQIAFLVNVNGVNVNGKPERQLTIVPTAGGQAREIYRGNYYEISPSACAWTHDGRYLLFRAADADSGRLQAVPVAGGNARPLDISMPGLRSPSVSPDGRRIAFTAGASREELWVVRNLLTSQQPSR